MKFTPLAFTTFVLSCACSQQWVHAFSPVRTVRPTGLRSGLRSSILQETQGQNNEPIVTELEVDRAPCHDGVCVSRIDGQQEENKVAIERAGEAIKRLGSMTGPTVWAEFGRLSQEHEVANLGQGFPDWLPPSFARESLVEVTVDSMQSPHQYTRTAGHPNLVKELASRYSVHMDREVHPMSEVAVTVGASQAIYLSLQSLVEPGDEVILFEPFFDLYVNQVKLAGGTPVYVPLTFVPYDKDESAISGGEWILEEKYVIEAISPKTKAIILNSPHNPTGKLFSREEMEMIATVVQKDEHQKCVVLSDEVYKYIIHAPPASPDSSSTDGDVAATKNFDQVNRAQPPVKTCVGHTHFASLPGMWDRTVTISSAGKTFSATGWQVGWCIGPKHLISPIQQLLPYVQFCASTVMQEALARSLHRADEPYKGFPSYYAYLKDRYTKKRDLLSESLKAAGFGVPDYSKTTGGGFFIFARIGKEVRDAIPKDRVNVANPAAPGGIARQDWALCQWMAEEKGVLCIPASPFFSQERAIEGASDEFVRIAFCKTNATIEDAAKAFSKLKDAVTNDDSDEENNILLMPGTAKVNGVSLCKS